MTADRTPSASMSWTARAVIAVVFGGSSLWAFFNGAPWVTKEQFVGAISVLEARVADLQRRDLELRERIDVIQARQRENEAHIQNNTSRLDFLMEYRPKR